MSSEPQTYMLVDKNDNIVNAILWSGDAADWQPPAGIRAFCCSSAWQDGWKWDGKQPYDPNPPKPVPEPPKTKKPKKIDGTEAEGMTVI